MAASGQCNRRTGGGRRGIHDAGRAGSDDVCHRRTRSWDSGRIGRRQEARRVMPIPTLTEKLEWLKPAKASSYEEECAKTLRQGDYEIGVQVTNDILDEAMEIFIRSSRSYFGVSGDSMVAIFTAGGGVINRAGCRYFYPLIHPVLLKILFNY